VQSDHLSYPANHPPVSTAIRISSPVRPAQTIRPPAPRAWTGAWRVPVVVQRSGLKPVAERISSWGRLVRLRHGAADGCRRREVFMANRCATDSTPLCRHGGAALVGGLPAWRWQSLPKV